MISLLENQPPEVHLGNARPISAW